MHELISPVHWLLFGAVLMVIEIFAPSFTLFWFGLSGVLIAFILWLCPTLTITTQILIWVCLSVLIMFIWFKYIKPRAKDRTHAGMSRENTIGQVGMVIQVEPNQHELIVHFPMPILGSDKWHCRCIQSVAVGERVIVTDILGNQLLVDPKTQ